MIENLVKQNEGLIFSIASKFYNIEIDELYQLGVLGLIKAYKNYDERGLAKFSTFAYKYIFGEMYAYSIKRNGINYNKESLALYKKVLKVQELLVQKYNKIPTNNDIALYLEVEESLVEKVLIIGENMISINEDNGIIENYSSNVIIDDSFIDLSESINKLDLNEQRIIKYRFFNDFTQQETASLLNMTQVMISRYEKKSIQKLKKILS